MGRLFWKDYKTSEERRKWAKDRYKNETEENRAKRLAYHRRYNRRNRTKQTKQKRESRLRHLEYHRAYRRTYMKTYFQNPDESRKNAIRHLHNRQVEEGLIEKKVCQLCGSTEKLELHHFTYSKVFDGCVLCMKCHKKLHFSP